VTPGVRGRCRSAVVTGLVSVVSAQVRGHVADGVMVPGVRWRLARSRCNADAWRTGSGAPGSGFQGQPWAACAGVWSAAMACGILRWAQGAVDEGVGGLFLAGDGMGVDVVQDGEAVPGAGGCFLGCDTG